jgi:hypothetical protein
MADAEPGNMARTEMRIFRGDDERTVQAQQEEAIAALLSEQTVAAAAAKAGISEAMLVDWMKIPAFDGKYRAARRAAAEAGAAAVLVRLQQATSDAVDALIRNLTCGVPAVEVAAARAILQQAGEGDHR